MSDELISRDIVCEGGMPAFVVRPAGAGPFPIVVLMHERYGLVQHTRDQARRCARDGYLAIAPDFFFRHPEPAVLNAGDSRYDITDPESVELIDAAIAAAKKEPEADGARIAVAGYCQTGRHPLVYASQRKITAAVVWYGAASKREWAINERQPETLETVLGRLDCPVFGAFGAADHIISIEDVRRFRNCLEAGGKSFDIHVYADAPHGWLNDTMPGRYRKAQAEAGWAHQQAFLSSVFGGQRSDRLVTQSYDCAFAADYDFSRNVRLE